MENTNLKTVALVGRPNVGKSTLFNRLVGRREAIETSVAGTTRDRLYGEVFWRNKKFNLIDLAGLEFGSKAEMNKSIQESVQVAIEEADLIVAVLDWGDRNNEIDKKILRDLRLSKKNVIIAVNKCDNLSRMESLDEFKRFGPYEVVPVSAISGKSTGDFLDEIVKKLPETEKVDEKPDEENSFNLAIIGRPNVGKSTLLNSIIGKKRAVVSDVAGTTRDIIKVEFHHKDAKINIIDTAGLRRRGKIERDTIESFSVLRTEKAMRDADVVILVIDAEEGLVAGDAHILGRAEEMGKGVLLAVNKLDVVGEEKDLFMGEVLSELQVRLNFVPWIPVVFISAQEGENVKTLLNQAVKVYKNRQTVISQEDLDGVVDFAKNSNNQLQYIKYLKQKRTNPPAFELRFFKRKPHYTQIRYLENKLRDAFPMEGTPIFIDVV